MAKSPVAIVVDSTSYIPPELVESYHIHVIPQILNWEGESFLDDVDIKPEAFYARLKTAKEMPTTSQPSAGEFYDFFSKVAETADSIVAVLISEYLSGTVASANAAVEMMGDYPIEVVDTRSTSMGLGFIALEAAKAAEQGQNYKEVAEAARALIPAMRILFVVDTLEFLHRGGRIGGASRLLGSMLSMKPLLHIEEGRIEPLARVRTKRKAVQHLLDVIADDTKDKKDIRLSVIHAAAAEEASALRDEIQERFGLSDVLVAELSPVVGTHAGPGTVGTAYYSAA